MLNKLLLFTLCVSFIHCASTKQSSITEESGQIPQGFGKQDVTVLAITHSKNYNKYLEKTFSENYHGKYQVVDYGELKTKYADINQYKYIFSYTQTTDRGTMGSNGVHSSTTSYIFYLEDRKNNQRYEAKQWSSFFVSDMKAYIQAMERIREKNK